MLYRAREALAILTNRPVPDQAPPVRRKAEPGVLFCDACGYKYPNAAVARANAKCPICGAKVITNLPTTPEARA